MAVVEILIFHVLNVTIHVLLVTHKVLQVALLVTKSSVHLKIQVTCQHVVYVILATRQMMIMRRAILVEISA